ncbi:glycoside hydrolase family 43 protein [Draconibacterium sediminis]|uniref:Glycosyl hydrolase family 43 n=1 Tax=Draconibacterium sediminis TaxID=1544798 RepID=A0A0D8JEZ4_9BACT|nr:glycoside hydrolase family 43 protein [Draconibacterium sediminis]KJF45304.1 glycosyl hydrolase family 43 [Draconibacterium sediminis]
MKKLIFIIVLFVIGNTLIAQPETYKNPILPGYHPDPSICRVGEDYYLVNSSFEWYPGLPVYHSKDLVNWELIGYGMHRPEQVELPVGLGDSRGVYAPTIRYHEGVFYIINTCVQCKGNFYITATNPAGPWSDPVWLGSRGIDPDLFWDDDGTCYYTGHANITGVNDWPDKNGAWMQELDLEQEKLVGPQKQLTHGHAKNARWTEGPHMYKIGGKYMLMVAEGGTGFHHATTVHHSDSVWGPYIPNHSNPVLTHRHLGQNYPIHSVGHTDLVQTQNGDWWAVMLGKRSVDGSTLLARESFLAPVEFQEQEGVLTPVFNPGVGKLLEEQKRPDLPWTPVEKPAETDNFEKNELELYWNFLRTPYKKWYELKDNKLNIQLRPEVADSMVNPSLIARRIEDHVWEASTLIAFKSKKANEQAGIIIYRNSQNHFQLVKEKGEVVLVKTKKGVKTEVARTNCTENEVVLKIKANKTRVEFSFGKSETELKNIGGEEELTLISDEVAGGFNGPYVGMYATSNGEESNAIASFDWFKYEGK